MQIIGEQLWLTKTLKSKEKCYDGLRLWKEKCENEVERKTSELLGIYNEALVEGMATLSSILA